MAVTSRSASGLTGSTTAADDKTADNGPIVAKESAADTKPAEKEFDGVTCVVDDGTAHMGRATPGAVICSAHAMRYKADGTPRG